MKILEHDAPPMVETRGVNLSTFTTAILRWRHLAIAVILTLAVGLRFYDLSTESYWLDEIIMVRLTTSDTQSLFRELLETGRPPVYVVLGHAWTNLFGSTETATRSLSAVAGVFGVLAIYALGKALFGETVGLLSALLMTLSGFQIAFSQDFRYYSVFVLFGVLSWLFFYRFLQRGRSIDLLLYIGMSVLLVYTHVYGIFAIAAGGLYFLLRWRQYSARRLDWFAAQVAILFCVAPGLYLFFVNLIRSEMPVAEVEVNATPPTSWIPLPTVYAPARTMLNFMFGSKYLSYGMMAAIIGLFAAGLFVFALRNNRAWLRTALPEGLSVLRGLMRKKHSELLFVLCWLFVPIVIVFVVSFIVTPIYWDRYLSTSAPALYILIAALVFRLRKVVPLALSFGLLATLLVLNLAGYYQQPVKEQWRESAAFVQSNLQDGDTIVIGADIFPEDAGNVQNSFNYYAETPARCIVDLNLTNDALLNEWQQCTDNVNRVWLVTRFNHPEEVELVAQFLEQASYGRVTLVSHTPFRSASVYLFETG